MTIGTPPPPLVYEPPEDPFLTVLHSDEDILVLDKPAELLSVAGKAPEHYDCLEYRAVQRFPSATIVHRLDCSTSGVMVMALNAQSHRNISAQFEKRRTRKSYIARVWGHMEEDQGHVDLPLICDWPNRPKQMVCFEHGKSSQTDWDVIKRETLEDGAPVTRVRLSPITGRSHQLRVHMLSVGHPILGDNFYAHEDAFKAAERLQLHAEVLTLFHPTSGEEITFSAPCEF